MTAVHPSPAPDSTPGPARGPKGPSGQTKSDACTRCGCDKAEHEVDGQCVWDCFCQCYVAPAVLAASPAVTERVHEPELDSGAGWSRRLGWHILDPDGWRGDNTPWPAAITREEFERRAARSTARPPVPAPPAVTAAEDED